MYRSLILLIVLPVAPLLHFACESNPPDSRTNEAKQPGDRSKTEKARQETKFSMEQYAWENRPLLIFAPSPDDSRYRKQKRKVDQATEEFRDRDMVLIRVFSSGDSSRAGDQPLSASDAQQLRQTYDVHPDSFSVLLVGKDTGVKRRSTRPVDIQDIFDQIDRMPMRQREMERRSENE
jgi:hypothetical protein